MYWTLLAVGKREGFAQLGAMGEVVAGCGAGGLGAGQCIGGGMGMPTLATREGEGPEGTGVGGGCWGACSWVYVGRGRFTAREMRRNSTGDPSALCVVTLKGWPAAEMSSRIPAPWVLSHQVAVWSTPKWKPREMVGLPASPRSWPNVWRRVMLTAGASAGWKLTTTAVTWGGGASVVL